MIGVNPQSVRGSRTGVFIGNTNSDVVDVWGADCERLTGYELIGSAGFMLANRLSYFFDFKGLYSAICIVYYFLGIQITCCCYAFCYCE